MVNSKREKIDGVLLLDKPCGISSNHALQRSKRRLNALKAGHTGTLDPLASGLLPLTFGEATKFSQMLLEADKVYEVEVQFGKTTSTGDAEGELIQQISPDFQKTDLERVLSSFLGTIQQLPPMYSALKHQGRPLYDYARKGIEIPREYRQVNVHRLDLLDFDQTTYSCCIKVHCSKGTYIRSLAMDIGDKLQCGAYVKQLRRCAIGQFDISQAISLQQLEESSAPRHDLLPVDTLVQHLPSMVLTEQQALCLRQGMVIQDVDSASQGLHRIYYERQFLGLATFLSGKGLSAKRLIASI